MSNVKQLATKLVIDNLGNTNLEAAILDEPVDRSSDWLVLFYRRTHNLRKDVAVEEKGEGHLSAEPQALLLQVGLELSPELPFGFRNGSIHESLEPRSDRFPTLHFLRRSRLVHLELCIVYVGGRRFRHLYFPLRVASS